MKQQHKTLDLTDYDRVIFPRWFWTSFATIISFLVALIVSGSIFWYQATLTFEEVEKIQESMKKIELFVAVQKSKKRKR